MKNVDVQDLQDEILLKHYELQYYDSATEESKRGMYLACGRSLRRVMGELREARKELDALNAEVSTLEVIHTAADRADDAYLEWRVSAGSDDHARTRELFEDFHETMSELYEALREAMA